MSDRYCDVCGGFKHDDGMASCPARRKPPAAPTADEMPADPFTGAADEAVSTHELFRSYVDSGFTEDQALQMVMNVQRILLQTRIGIMLAQGVNPFEAGQ